MRILHQPVEIGERSVVGMHGLVIGDVIAPIAIGRGMDRRKPDAVDAEARDIIELAPQAFEIALPVAVRVAEAADIDLVDGGAAPPGRSAHTSSARWMT